jgi:predicted DNA-binding transcriptional regulator YafY
MRADRLLQLILLLQIRGRTPAWRLAQELEVSERTVYRDIADLSAAGIPVYGEAGPQGGYSLVENYRTSLTGLTAGEAQALFMLNVPEPLRLLGLDEVLKTALLKLAAALPASRQADEEHVRRRFYLDTAWWQGEGQSPAAAPHLQTVHHAVWGDRCLSVRVRFWSVEVESLVQPYGLVAKAGAWYLVAARAGRLRVYAIADFLDAHLTEQTFQRPADFDLPAFWREWCLRQATLRSGYGVLLRVRGDFVTALAAALGPGVLERLEPAGPDGSRRLAWDFASLDQARSRLLAFGRGVEVLEPHALRRSLLDYAGQVIGVYAITGNSSSHE